MINAYQRDLILRLSLNKINKDEFIKRFPEAPTVRYLHDELESALTNKDGDSIEYLLLLGFHFGFDRSSSSVLCSLIMQDWHMQHENIATILADMRAPDTVECLYAACFAAFPYLDYDESYSLGVKCIYALNAIGTKSAQAKLALIAQGNNKILAENARRFLA